MLTRVAAILLVVGAVACNSKPSTNPLSECDPQGNCPTGFACDVGSNFCVQVSSLDAGHVDARPAVPDAGPPDAAPPPDATVVPPDTTITAAPPALTNQIAVSFSFTSSVTPSTFECRVDTAAFAACSSPASETVSGDGAHSFDVRAVDSHGNADPTPAHAAWNLDTTPPDTSITAGPAASGTDTSATFAFASTEANSTFACALDGAVATPCTSPQAYGGLAVGDHVFTVTATDAAGNSDATAATQSWTIVAPAIDTTILTGPSPATTATAATFTFSATPADGATFACSLDGAAFVACTSPQSYSGLGTGAHTFDVEAANAVASDASPAHFTWAIDPTGAVAVITTGFNSGVVCGNSATIAYTTSGAASGVTFECSLNSGFQSCGDGQQTFSGLNNGQSYLFTVHAVVDGVAGPDASVSFVDDSAPPMVTISSPGAGTTTGPRTSIAFDTGGAHLAQVQCLVDGAAVPGCQSGTALTGLTTGDHTVTVNATDVCANAGTASSTWTVDATGPTVTISSPQPGSIVGGTGTVVFALSDDATGVTCAFDGGSVACTAAASVFSYSTSSDGPHTATVTAVDKLGNVGTASTTFTTDSTPPTVTALTADGAAAQGNATFDFALNDLSGVAHVFCGVDGVPLDAPCGQAGSSGSVTLTGLPTGNHTLDVYGVDNWGNSGRDKSIGGVPGFHVSVTFFEDASAPVVTALAEGLPEGGGAASFTFTLIDDTGIGDVHCVLDGTTDAVCGDGAGEATFTGTFDATGLASGDHTLDVYAIDDLGNDGATATPGSAPTTRAQLAFTIDATPPIVTALSQGAAEGNGNASFSFTVTDATGIGDVDCVVDSGTATVCGTGTAGVLAFNGTFDPTGLTTGSHTLDVYAVDTLGNDGATATPTTAPATRAHLAFSIDATPPTVTTLTKGTLSGTSVTFSYALSDPSGISAVHCFLNGSEEGAPCGSSASGSFTFTGVVGGTNTVEVYGVDGLGNSGASAPPTTAPAIRAQATFIGDTTPPNIDTLMVNGTPQDGALSVTIHASDPSGVASIHCFLDGVEVGAPCGTGVSGSLALTDVAAGPHTLEVYAIDAVGNSGAGATASTTLPTRRARVTFEEVLYTGRAILIGQNYVTTDCSNFGGGQQCGDESIIGGAVTTSDALSFRSRLHILGVVRDVTDAAITDACANALAAIADWDYDGETIDCTDPSTFPDWYTQVNSLSAAALTKAIPGNDAVVLFDVNPAGEIDPRPDIIIADAFAIQPVLTTYLDDGGVVIMLDGAHQVCAGSCSTVPDGTYILFAEPQIMHVASPISPSPNTYTDTYQGDDELVLDSAETASVPPDNSVFYFSNDPFAVVAFGREDSDSGLRPRTTRPRHGRFAVDDSVGFALDKPFPAPVAVQVGYDSSFCDDGTGFYDALCVDGDGGEPVVFLSADGRVQSLIHTDPSGLAVLNLRGGGSITAASVMSDDRMLCRSDGCLRLYTFLGVEPLDTLTAAPDPNWDREFDAETITVTNPTTLPASSPQVSSVDVSLGTDNPAVEESDGVTGTSDSATFANPDPGAEVAFVLDTFSATQSINVLAFEHDSAGNPVKFYPLVDWGDDPVSLPGSTSASWITADGAHGHDVTLEFTGTVSNFFVSFDRGPWPAPYFQADVASHFDFYLGREQLDYREGEYVGGDTMLCDVGNCGAEAWPTAPHYFVPGDSFAEDLYYSASVSGHAFQLLDDPFGNPAVASGRDCLDFASFRRARLADATTDVDINDIGNFLAVDGQFTVEQTGADTWRPIVIYSRNAGSGVLGPDGLAVTLKATSCPPGEDCSTVYWTFITPDSTVVPDSTSIVAPAIPESFVSGELSRWLPDLSHLNSFEVSGYSRKSSSPGTYADFRAQYPYADSPFDMTHADRALDEPGFHADDGSVDWVSKFLFDPVCDD